MSLVTASLTPAERLEVARALEEFENVATAVSARSLMGYMSCVTIDSRPAPRRFSELAEPWQWAAVRTLAPMIESVAGTQTGYQGPMNAFLVMPRGHDKSSGVARLLNWALAFAPNKNLRIQVAAADRGQAQQIGDFAQTEASLNPWLYSRLKFARNQIVSRVNGGVLDILAADAAGSFGAKPDILYCDELVWWQKPDLFQTLFSGMAKRPGSSTLITTNAGLLHTWQDEVRKMARRNPKSWFVYESPGCIASWMSQEKIAEIAQGLPKSVADRVLGNVWKDGSEENGFCTRAEAQRCADLGAALGLRRQHRGDPRFDYVAAVDYGLVKDRTVLCVCHLDPEGRVIVDRMDVWQGRHGSPVHADDVQLWIEQQHAAFNCRFVLDPHQLQPVIQRLRHLPIEEFEYRGGRGNYKAASNLLTLIRSDRLAWHPGCGDIPRDALEGPHTVVDELAELIVKPMPYGWRMDHEQMAGRHDDRVTAVAMAALKLTEIGPQASLATFDERFF